MNLDTRIFFSPPPPGLKHGNFYEKIEAEVKIESYILNDIKYSFEFLVILAVFQNVLTIKIS